MKILFFTHYFTPEVNAPATRTHEHGRRWAAAGHDVTILTGRPNCPHGVVFDGYQNRLRSETEMMDGMRVVRVWTHIAANAGTVWRTVNYLSYLFSAVLSGLFQPRPDVIVATSPQFFCAWAGLLVGFLRRVPVVVEIRDVWPASIQAVGAIRSRPALSVLVWLEWAMYRFARHIVTVGEGYRDHILQRLGNRGAAKVSIVTNGVDLQRFEPRSPDRGWMDEQRWSGKFICSYIGTIGMAHGLDVVLRAAASLQRKGRHDIVFCLVGDGAQRKTLEEQARQMGLQETVRFLGLRPKSEVQTILASSGALLVHLRGCELFETVIPSKIFEIMAMERPIIMGVAGEALRIIERAGAGIPMKPDSEDDLVRIVELLCDQPELHESLSAAGRRFVADYYNRDQLAAEMLAILQAVVDRRKPEPTRQDRLAQTPTRDGAASASAPVARH